MVNHGDDVLVLDKNKNSLTVFKPTPIMAQIREATVLDQKGEYQQALPLWEDILSQDRNFRVAYNGVAKALYEQGDMQGSMEYARIGGDRGTYAPGLRRGAGRILSAPIFGGSCCCVRPSSAAWSF